MTRSTLVLVVACTVIGVQPSSAKRVGRPDPEYKAEVNKILLPALLHELAEHYPKVTMTLSFTIDTQGRQTLLEVSSSPHNHAADRAIARVIRSLRFPPAPKKVIGEYRLDAIQFDLTLRPKG